MSVVTGTLIILLLFGLRFGLPFLLTVALGRLLRLYDNRAAVALGT